MSSGGESGKEEEEKEKEEEEEQEEEKKFFVDVAKTGRASCKRCKQKIDAGTLRLARAGYNPFGPGPLKQWHHVHCLFEQFKKQRAATARIHTPDDIGGWSDVDPDHQDEVLKFLPDVKAEDYKTEKKEKPTPTPKKRKTKKGKGNEESSKDEEKEKKPKKQSSSAMPASLAAVLPKSVPDHKDNTFREFRRLCVVVANESSYTGKTALVKKLFDKGTAGDGFKGNLRLWIKLLIPGAVKRVYNLQSKQLVKLFSRVLRQNQDEMLEDLEKGDVAETVSKFFEKSTYCRPAKKSLLTLQEVDHFLQELSQLTREDDQTSLFTQICVKCTSNDLLFIIRLVKSDLRINAGAKHILEALHPDAYLAFQTSRDIDTVLEEIFSTNKQEDKGSSNSLKIGVKLMTPVLPMLAEACKSVEQALKKCPNGMYSEIKYDGERVQVHKCGSEFKYFSRSLKPVMPHKVKEFKDYIPKAFPGGDDLILDSEILMIDTNTGTPLPFGTLGIHKKGEYKDACVCLFVFDCIYYNGKSLLHQPIRKRRKILHESMTEIENHVVFSEMQEVHNAKDLENMMTKVFQMGLEGLVLKDLESPYEPGKRHWLKVKKDYLFGGAMADTADLVVLGAWFGTGQKGGMMSVFLMGCWDPVHKYWCTVTKVHTGHDDKTLERLQTELKMEKISKEVHRVPCWLKCTKTMVPDFVAKIPKEMPVWEITGAEFTKHDVHTAAGISIRFPRVTRIRDDKNWKTATSLPELKELFKKSKDNTDFCLPSHFTSDDNNTESEKKSEEHSYDKDDSPKMKNVRSETSECNSPQGLSGRNHSPKKNHDLHELKIKKEFKDKLNSREESPSPKHRSKCIPSDDAASDTGDNSKSPCIKKNNISNKSKSNPEENLDSSSFNEVCEDKPNQTVPQKRKKATDSSEIDLPSKKVKQEESTETNQINPKEIYNSSLVSSNCENFVRSLISELQLISNPVLYHRVKGQLFDIIHNAQDQQLKLISSECECKCGHCFCVCMSESKGVDPAENTCDIPQNDKNTNPPIVDNEITHEKHSPDSIENTSVEICKETQLLTAHELSNKEKNIDEPVLENNEKDLCIVSLSSNVCKNDEPQCLPVKNGDSDTVPCSEINSVPSPSFDIKGVES